MVCHMLSFNPPQSFAHPFYLASIALAISLSIFTSAFAAPELFEPLDGTTYFGFTFRNWDTSSVAWGDTRPFVVRYQDAIDQELGGRDASLFAVPTLWQNADGSFVPFSTALNDINRYTSFHQGKSIPLISWNVQTGWGITDPSYSGITTKTIVEGTLDAYIRQYAQDVKAYARPIFIRPICGEVNGNWWQTCSPNANPDLTKADFINAWRHVVQIFREEGVTNVGWVWNLNTFPASPVSWGIDTDIVSYYPGDEYVDWVGVDHYDYGNPSTPATNPFSVAQYLDPHYEFAVAHRKPFFLAEWGVRHPSSVLTATQHQQWINAVFDYVESRHLIKAILYFNYHSGNKSVEDAAHLTNHVSLYDGTVNFHPDVNNGDHRLLTETEVSLRDTFASRIAHPRYVSDIAVNTAKFISQNVPLVMTGGISTPVSITIENTGIGTLWTNNDGYQLQSLNPVDSLTWGVQRVLLDLSDAVGFGQRKTFTFMVTPPTAVGSYNFQWGMMQNGVGSFSEPSENLFISVPTVADTTPPTVSITSPVNGSTIRRSALLTITASASDASGVARVEFRVNGVLKCTDTVAPYTCAWQVPSAKKTSYTLNAKAFDTAGNFADSTVSVISQR